MRYKPMTTSQYKGYCIAAIVLAIIEIILCWFSRFQLSSLNSMIFQILALIVFLIIFAFLNHKMNRFRG